MKAGFLFLFILIFIGLIVGFFYLPQFRIKEISIKSNDNDAVGQQQLVREVKNAIAGKFFGIFPADNFFILPKGKIIANILNKSLLFKNVSIDKIFPQKISIDIETRKPEALWCLDKMATSTNLADPALRSFSEGGCAFVDDDGFIFKLAPDFSGPIFLKFFDERPAAPEIGKNMLLTDQFKNLIIFKNLLAGRDINIQKINLKEDGIFELYASEGWYLILSEKNEPTPSLNNLELILDGTIKDQRPNLEYIDLRFGNKVFYKLK